MLQFIASFFVLFSQIQYEQLLHFQLLSCLSNFSSSSRGLSCHGLSDPSGIFNFLLDIIDQAFQFSQVPLHLLNLSFDFFLLALVISSLILDSRCTVNNDDCVLFDLLLFGFLFTHFGGDDGELLSNLFDDHLCLFDNLLLLTTEHLLLFVFSFHLLRLLTGVVDPLGLGLDVTGKLLYPCLLVHNIDL